MAEIPGVGVMRRSVEMIQTQSSKGTDVHRHGSPAEPVTYRIAVQRLQKRIDGLAASLGVDGETARQVVERVVTDMPSRLDEERLVEARKRLLIATE